MGHTLITLNQDRFYTRVILGTTLLNINGNTHLCDVKVERKAKHSIMKAYDKETNEFLGEWCEWHMHGGPDMYQLEGMSLTGGDATLIVRPALGNWERADAIEAMGEDLE